MFAEFLVLAGSVAICAFTINFWVPAADLARPWLFNDPRVDIVVFGLIFLNLLLAVRLLTIRIVKLIPVESSNWIMHGGGFALGCLNGIWWSAVLICALLGTAIPYLRASTLERSIIGSRLAERSRWLVTEVTGQFPGAANRREGFVPPLMPKEIGSTQR